MIHVSTRPLPAHGQGPLGAPREIHKAIVVMRTLRIVGAWSIATALFGAEPNQLLEVRIGRTPYTGKIAAKNAEHFWLLQRDGRLDSFAIADVADYKPLGGAFHPLTSTELRDRLQGEFGRGYEVTASTHYLVVVGRGEAKRYVTLFEELYRQMHVYLSARGFSIREPEFPLVAIVFPDRAKFADYCRQEKVPSTSGLMGYYLQTSNRVALYDTGATDVLDETIVHEAVHQVAFNLGLHRRIGENPQWLVEGLATTFEPENFRSPLPSTPTAAKINRERYVRFRTMLTQRRDAFSLESIIKNDRKFQEETLDAYAEAWALTFFLMQTRQEQFSGYLKRIARHPAAEPYSPEARLEDFQRSFGGNLTQLQADLVRFHAGLVR
jgi:hypothetical protein